MIKDREKIGNVVRERRRDVFRGIMKRSIVYFLIKVILFLKLWRKNFINLEFYI